MNEDQIHECELDIRRIEELVGSNIFSPDFASHPLVGAALTELLICLRDLMWKCEKFATRISFDDDVCKVGKVRDVTDAVKHLRDAACHVDSDLRDCSWASGSVTNLFMVSHGDMSGIRIAGQILGGMYPDDVAFTYGGNRVYLRRHILRAFAEAKQRLEPFLRLSA